MPKFVIKNILYGYFWAEIFGYFWSIVTFEISIPEHVKNDKFINALVVK